MFFEIPFFHAKSLCPQCKNPVAWYDNIPIFSWLFLKGKCRYCQKPISWLYPFIELITTVSFWLLIERISPQFWISYFLFFSALIISIRTDLETLLISRFVTLWLIPIGLLLSYCAFLPISLLQSLVGTFTGYICLFSIAQLYYLITKRVGMGQGDVELLAFIGAFTGFIGWWLTLLIASFIGTFTGLTLMFYKRSSLITMKIPFGPFLALGAMIFVLFQTELIRLVIRL